MSIDPQLVAEWQHTTDGTRWLFQPDSTFHFGTIDVPYSVSDSGDILNINNKSFYTRLSGSVLTSIVGHWRDDPNGEEITYRDDGRYIGSFDGDPLTYLGTYTASPTTVSSYSYRGTCSTSDNQITFHSIYDTWETDQYTVTDDTLVIQKVDSTITFTRVIPAS